MFNKILDAILEAGLDSLKIFPILFLVYILIEYFTHKKEEKFVNLLKKNSRFGPLFGAALGCIPQCGFSAVMADMFNHKLIGFGTLIAVFVSTSDEAIPIMLSYPDKILQILLLLLIKFLIAVFFGYLFYFLFLWLGKIKNKKELQKQGAIITTEEYLHNHECQISNEHLHHNEHKDKNEQCECCTDNIFLSALKHSFIILLYIFVANLIINLIFTFVGETVLINALSVSPYLQIVLSPLIGLIPNCVSSVVLIELYLNNTLIFPALIGGLSAGSGVGLIVLFKNRKNYKQNFLILILLYLIGVITGLLLNLIF